MASIIDVGGKFRAQIERQGVRKSKTFPSREAAEAWAATTERRVVDVATKKAALANSTLLSFLPRRILDAMGSAEYSHDDVARGAIPMPMTSGVYFLVRDNRVVYVGQSLDVLHRISRHRREGRNFDSYNYLLCEPARMNELESIYIAAFMPSQNWSFGNKWRAPRAQEDLPG